MKISTPGTQARTVLDRPATRELVPRIEGESFRWMEHDYPSEIARWNYHPEVEIHLIRRSIGSYIIGDQIGAFGPGHVAVVGSGLPHDWMSDLVDGQVVRNRDAVIQFTPDWIEHSVDVMPELAGIRQLVQESGRGIIYSGPTAATAAERIEAVGATAGPLRIAHLLSLLSLLLAAPDSDKEFVASSLYSSDTGGEGKAAVDAGLAYVLENLSGHIRMSEAARLAYMSEPSFSKYFKKASGMTFSDLVRRLRIANACRLLDQTESTVSTISDAVGYRNLANFNRQFRAETGITPRQYRSMDESARPNARLRGLKLTSPD
jgi:AraC-like DNA-binding protein